VKKIPLRKCVDTNERLPKQELVRIVKNNEGKVFVDLSEEHNTKITSITDLLLGGNNEQKED
jgi:predicted RNA-binding protein YlxR (DUF448 family)